MSNCSDEQGEREKIKKEKDYTDTTKLQL